MPTSDGPSAFEDPALPRAIVALGASAGGVTALRTLLSGLPEDAAIAVGVVLHLSDQGEDNLAAVLATACRLPVEQVTGPTPLRCGRVYVIPPGANLEITDRLLRLSALSADRAVRAPIDHFFRSVADAWGTRAVAVVLSGSGTDGALGIRAVKDVGGVTIAQDPNEAEFDGMPQAAISTGAVDLVLPLAAIAGAVLRVIGAEPVPSSADGLSESEHGVLQAIFTQLRSRVGRDFTRYKHSTLLRRIERRMQIRELRDLAGYLELLRADVGETHALAEDLLVTVTRFFRDPEAFQCLRQQVLPGILRERSNAGDEVRVWSAGCSSGEEAYSLAIVLIETAEAIGSDARLQVFATDLHEPSLARARDGFYPAGIRVDVEPERLTRFFVPEDGGYRVRKEVRDLIVFARHDLLGDPPFSRIDLVLCRNVMIYLQREAQRDMDSVFHYALRPGGFLLVGNSETVVSQDLFALENKRHSVYRRRDVPTPERRLPLIPGWHGVPEFPQSIHAEMRPPPYAALHQRLLLRWGPPSLLLGPDDEVVNLSGAAGRYLLHPPGQFTAVAHRLIREELRVDLGTAVAEARRAEPGAVTRTLPTKVGSGADVELVSLCVRTSPDPQDDGYLLVQFEQRELSPEELDSRAASGDDAASPREKKLQAEVEVLRQRLEKVVDDYESSQEQMKASNEELQSANEELRSTMEELQTSKEELQSINEELSTVNQENRQKVHELAELTADLQSLLEATEIAMLFLDTGLRIVRFTPKVGELINIRATDRGRPISDLTHRLGYPGLHEDAAGVLANLVSVEREVRSDAGRSYYVRVLPYRVGGDRIAGVIITIVDLTPLRRAEAALSHSEERYRQVFQPMGEAFALCDVIRGDDGVPIDWRFVEVNEAWAVQAGTDAPVVGNTIRSIAPRIDESWIRNVGDAVRRGRPAHFEGFVADFGRWFDVHVFPHGGDRFGLLTFDCTARRDSQREQEQLLKRLRESEFQLRELDRQKDRFVAMLAHELRSPLAPLAYAADLLSKDSEALTAVLPIIEAQVRRLTRLVNDLGSLARATRDGLGLTVTDDADLGRAIRDAAKVVAQRIASRQQKLTLPKEATAPLRGDQMRLEQIMWNLLDNASKYSGVGAAIDVALHLDDDFATVRVRDGGRGIDPADQDRIFEAFTRCSEDGPEGLGLGLPIVKQLVEAHGGTVAVESDGVGHGATFVVRLPRRGPPVADG